MAQQQEVRILEVMNKNFDMMFGISYKYFSLYKNLFVDTAGINLLNHNCLERFKEQNKTQKNLSLGMQRNYLPLPVLAQLSELALLTEQLFPLLLSQGKLAISKIIIIIGQSFKDLFNMQVSTAGLLLQDIKMNLMLVSSSFDSPLPSNSFQHQPIAI